MRQDAARAADRGAIAVHGRDAALTNFMLACYGPDERQRAGADLLAFLALLRPPPPSPPGAVDPDPDPDHNPVTDGSAQRCGYCAACRQPWRRGRHGRRLRCLNALQGAGDVPGAPTPALTRGLQPPVPRCPGSRAAGSAAGAAPGARDAAAAEAGAAGASGSMETAAALGQAAGPARGLGSPVQGRVGPGGGVRGPGGDQVKVERAADVLARATRQLYTRQEEQRAMDVAIQHGAPWREGHLLRVYMVGLLRWSIDGCRGLAGAHAIVKGRRA